MVTDTIKKKVMEEAMKFFASERGQKLLQNPKLMQALMKAMELKGKAQNTFDQGVDRIQGALNVATTQDLKDLQQIIEDLRSNVEALRRQTSDLAARLAELQDSKNGG